MKAENDYINMRPSIFECIYHCSGADEPQCLFESGKIR